MAEITIVDWFSLGIAIAAFVISGFVSIWGLTISFKTYRARFKPFLVPLKKKNTLKYIVQNIGNGPAINPYIYFYLENNDKLYKQRLHHLPAGYYSEIDLTKIKEITSKIINAEPHCLSM